MALLEEMYQCWDVLRESSPRCLQNKKNFQFLQCHSCPDAAMMIMDQTSEPINQPQLNVDFISVALVMVSVHSSKTLTKTMSILRHASKFQDSSG